VFQVEVAEVAGGERLVELSPDGWPVDDDGT
jgi:hypothetical protein